MIKAMEMYWHDLSGPEAVHFIWANINSSYQKIEHLDKGKKEGKVFTIFRYSIRMKRTIFSLP